MQNIVKTGGGENLKRPNVELPIFRNSKIANSIMMKHELFDTFIFEFILSFFFGIIRTTKIFDNFSNRKIGICQIAKF